jgi:hypothetical protein
LLPLVQRFQLSTARAGGELRRLLIALQDSALDIALVG